MRGETKGTHPDCSEWVLYSYSAALYCLSCSTGFSVIIIPSFCKCLFLYIYSFSERAGFVRNIHEQYYRPKPRIPHIFTHAHTIDRKPRIMHVIPSLYLSLVQAKTSVGSGALQRNTCFYLSTVIISSEATPQIQLYKDIMEMSINMKCSCMVWAREMLSLLQRKLS